MESFEIPFLKKNPECRDPNCRDLHIGLHQNNKDHTIYEYTNEASALKSSVDANESFTNNFLEKIDKSKPADESKLDSYLSDVIRSHFNKDNQLMEAVVVGKFPTTDPAMPTANHFIPSRKSLYFLFLANLYCKYKFYLAQYPWLDIFLFMCDQDNLTGIFAIDKHLYNVLFSECDKEEHGGYEIRYGYFLLSNSSIRLTSSFGNIDDDFLAQPSPLDTGRITLQIFISQQLSTQPQPSAAATQPYSVPRVYNPSGIRKSSKRSKPTCMHGKKCQSYGRTQTGTSYPPDLAHIDKYVHSGGKRTRKQSKRKQSKRKQSKRNSIKRQQIHKNKTIKRK
jgi:hypothetical protein